ncbi:neuraminidase-like domain-containing protein [Kitasatospora sp. GP82]|uniref:Tc toxin subunit A-related protein n=1 Tax=Kitasatospora sp. GP82 TaxID=3035089 RepID=UPI0024759E40|nr:neuraminidase-like domain-containing protein [Kitasatospora sp. GP82]MDH6125483.1 hypothetical protein [Kitasatospora sp. GP82]
MDYIIIRLHPTVPTTGDLFTSALTGLELTAYDMTFDQSSAGVPIGHAKDVVTPGLGVVFTPATTTVDGVTVPETAPAVVQHFVVDPLTDLPVLDPLTGNPLLEAAATVVMAVQPATPHAEYPTPTSYDVRLALTRGTEIADPTVNYNITTISDSNLPVLQAEFFTPDPNALPVAGYAAIPPAPPTGGGPVPDRVELPADGSAPNFDQLVNAVNHVLDKDPGTGGHLHQRPQLTVGQCRQIAAELVWDRVRYPPPAEPAELGAIYTHAPGDTSDAAQNAENERQKFEAQQTGYHATHDAEAARLAGFVFSASAAMVCERITAGPDAVTGTPPDPPTADSAALAFPVITGPAAHPVFLDTAVLLTAPTGATGLAPAFAVPAAYFYALGAVLPPQLDAAQRYDAARFAAESTVLQTLRAAVEAGSVGAVESCATAPGLGAIEPVRAARRLRALGGAAGALPSVSLDAPITTLVTDWLAHPGDSAGIDQGFWVHEVAAQPAAYLELVLRIVTGNLQPLIAAIKAPAFGVASVADLVLKTDQQWRQLFLGPPVHLDLLPAFAAPGTPAQRVEAFLRHLRRFFTVPIEAGPPGQQVTTVIPALGRSVDDVFDRFVTAYQGQNVGAFTLGTDPDPNALTQAVQETFPGDPDAQAWLRQALHALDELYRLTSPAAVPAELRFSLLEALYARGFTSRAAVHALTAQEFQAALSGTVAHPYAAAIQQEAGGPGPDPGQDPGTFLPVNPDGSLTDCVPPPHLSPFGPVAYLSELLAASATSTCDHPRGVGESRRLAQALADRRGPIAGLHATRANLQTPLPVIDLVNESLEALAAGVAPGGSGSIAGAVFDTAQAELAGHRLRQYDPATDPAGTDGTTPDGVNAQSHPAAGFAHDPATLFAALPEHSSPATVDVPTASTEAYAALRSDLSAPVLPYDQPLDVCRSYLCRLGTSRYAAMRRFRRDITEFVLDSDPAHEPAGFQRHRWRYPVRFELALEYLGISEPEYQRLYATGQADDALLRELYGVAPDDGQQWADTVLAVPEFLRRTGLTYCELLDLHKCGVVGFDADGPGARTDGEAGSGFPDCEPCCPDDLRIRFTEPADRQDPSSALHRLAVFIRLWRRLGERPELSLSFALLRALGEVLHLFDSAGAVNPDFPRQLAALLILCADLRLSLPEPSDGPGQPDGGVPLLALWGSQQPGPGRQRAVELLLDGVEDHAEARYACRRRGPEFAKVVADNLAPLSRLAGFAPDSESDTWYALPTHTLRFAEVLGKIYASDFTVGELLFLYTVDDHLDGSDPFPLPDRNESCDDPLLLPESGPAEDDGRSSLWSLRRSVLAVEVDEEEARRWSWARITTALREEFGYPAPPPGGADPLAELGEHFFPRTLERAGHPVDRLRRQYRTPLAGDDTSPDMWLGPPEGPFGYDRHTGELWTGLPLKDEQVIASLSELRPLREAEQIAVRDLYFAPRAALAPFAALFDNAESAIERLVSEPDEQERFAFFQRQFALFHHRCRAIADHLAAHVADVTGGQPSEAGRAAARQVLRRLLGDENGGLTPWEDDSGEPPVPTWQPQPSGGAFAALLGIAGTGLLGEYRGLGQGASPGPLWRETRGPLTAFGAVRDAHNAPVPTILPALDHALTVEQRRQVYVHNGFARSDADGTPLGGAQPFAVTWTGELLVEHGGSYRFHAGAPTEGDHEPDPAAPGRRWRLTLQRGQRRWVLLNHGMPGEDAPAAASRPLALRRGTYRITVEFEQCQPEFARPEDVCPTRTGFQLKYTGPDTGGVLGEIPHDRLFLREKDGTLGEGIVRHGEGGEGGAGGEEQGPTARIGAHETAAVYLETRYTSTLRDIRRTYQRAFKALLLAERFALSAHPVHPYRQSELGYLLDHPETFEGTSYPRTGTTAFATHHAWLDLDLLPVGDPYPPQPASDQRARPSARRQAALFDGWERLFDYARLRAQTGRAREHPAWLLFAEVCERQPDDPAELLRHLGVDLRHAQQVLHYYFTDGTTGTPELYVLDTATALDLADERWAVRIRQGETWLRRLHRCGLPGARGDDRWITDARVALWASDDPGTPVDAPPWVTPPRSGNADLAAFVRNGCFENGAPRRYEDLRRLNDGLRERARTALLGYLCGMDRVPLPFTPGAFAREPRDLSDLLLQDVLAGIDERTSRIEDAVRAVQAYVQRARLGLEDASGFTVGPAFVLLWERRFATFRTWESCRRREVYRENWIEWDDLRAARESEAFRFLEAELRRATLTVPVPGGLEWWPDRTPPEHPGLTVLQAREPAEIRLVPPVAAGKAPDEGLDVFGMPERAARPSWLAEVAAPSTAPTSAPDVPRPDGLRPTGGDAETVVAAATAAATAPPPFTADRPPLWLQAAVRLGTRFVRLAAAGIPPASSTFTEHPEPPSSGCCAPCRCGHPPAADEYYFWLADSAAFDDFDAQQDADLGVAHPDPANPDRQVDETSDWHRQDKLPGLLRWEPEPVVHLYWSRMHRGEFEPVRRSAEGVRVDSAPTAQLLFQGRTLDSLRFEVSGGQVPVGYPRPQPPAIPPPGFRYDLATDSAVVLPRVAGPQLPVLPTPSPFIGGLAAYPYFAYVAPGACLVPPSGHSVARTVAATLRTHCRYEAALKWYEIAHPPLHRDNTWARCVAQERETEGGEHRPDVACCPSSPVGDDIARDRAVLLAYLETLRQWGDALLCRNTPESDQQATVVFGVLDQLLGRRPVRVLARDTVGTAQTVAGFRPRPAPLNPRLLALYDLTADRLALVRHSLNGRRLRRPARRQGTRLWGDADYWGASELRDGRRESEDPCDADCDGAQECRCCASPYRFTFLVQKAIDLASEVRGLGAALLSAYEKGDAEALGALRATHERQLLELALDVRKNQWRDADWQVQALDRTKEGAQTRLRYYQQLVQRGLNAGETGYQALTAVSIGSRVAGNVSEAIAQGIGMIPDFWLGVAGIAGSPLQFQQLPLGNKLAAGFSTAARIMNALAEIANTSAGLSLTEGGWDRRLDEWHHQVDVTSIEIEQIERQILGAERRRDAALRELNNHQQQIENSVEVQDFLRSKFTNPELYLFLQQETAALHRQLYELARHTARRAQRAFNYERGHTAREFLPSDDWDNLHEGLLAGERLQLALRQMEGAYLDANCREYELTKHLSLRLDFPLAFLHLQTAGRAEIEVPEWMFDLDYPGHYLRRIRNVTMTIPCVVGPYTGVHCRLTLLSSTTRVDPRLTAPPAGCCDHAGGERPGPGHRRPAGTCCTTCGTESEEAVPDGYRAVPDDPRLVRNYGAAEAIATSSGQNDSGLFELNFRDERYLPFEFAGAVSRWRIELPPENNRFDLDTLGDAVLHLNYTAREGGEVLRRAANADAQRWLPGAGLRLFDIRHDFPDDWYRLRPSRPGGGGRALLPLRLAREHFPFLLSTAAVEITRLELFVQLADPDCRADLGVRFLTEHEAEHPDGAECTCAGRELDCLASAEWQGLYHGVLDTSLPLRSRGSERELGFFHFPHGVGALARVFLVCGYRQRER